MEITSRPSDVEISVNSQEDVENPEEELSARRSLSKKVVLVAAGSLALAAASITVGLTCKTEECRIASYALMGASTMTLVIAAVGRCAWHLSRP